MSKFIDDKVAEAIAATERGDTQAVGHAIIEAIKENDADMGTTMRLMNESLARQRNGR